jgi:hypothetical protein
MNRLCCFTQLIRGVSPRVIACCLLLFANAAAAESLTEFSEMVPLHPAVLDEMRGGFFIGGLQVDFGIETISQISRVQQPDLVSKNHVLQAGLNNLVAVSTNRFNVSQVAILQNSDDFTFIQSATHVRLSLSNLGNVIRTEQNFNLIRSIQSRQIPGIR